MKQIRKTRRTALTLLSLAALVIVVSCSATPPLSEDRKGFDSPEDAVAHVVSAIESGDMAALSGCLGPDCADILDSGDPIADKNGRESFVQRYREANMIERSDSGSAILLVGNEQWPLPIPLVEEEGAWYFDTAAGREEIIERRIGRQELNTIQACLAVADAQREYASSDWNGDGIYVYAQKIRSTPGMKDGLYWSSAAGEPLSPIGDLIADAEKEGYVKPEKEGARPYHGYFYKLLRAQGPSAAGGSLAYMAGDHMIGGFALIAWPARYGVSGIKSFMVNHNGVVYECDLGENSAEVAASASEFNPDGAWSEVKAEDLEPLDG